MSSVLVADWEKNLNISEDESSSIRNEKAKRILEFLRQGAKRINWTKFRHVILIFGNTGSGKTTLARFLAGDNRDLESYKIGKGIPEFLIRDIDNTISFDSTIISKTAYPDIYIDEENNDVYIDFPGFEDTGRDETFDLAAACFIKQVLEKATQVKIILTANHSSLRIGVSRNEFPLLLEHVSNLLTNVDKYLDSFALIATKVDPFSVPDSAIIESVAEFLKEVRDSWEVMRNSNRMYSSGSKREEDEKFYRNSIWLVNSLLEKNDDDEYRRLGIFKRPVVAGPVFQIQGMQENKTIIKTLLKSNLKYVRINAADIGYPVSFKSKYIIRDIADEITDNIKHNLIQLKSKLMHHYDETITKYSDDKEALKYHLATSYEGLDRIKRIDKSIGAVNFACHIRINLTEPCRLIAQSLLDDITILGKFLKFLGLLCARSFDSCAEEWIKSVESAIKFVENSLKEVSQMLEESNKSLFDWIMGWFRKFNKMLLEILQKMEEFFQKCLIDSSGLTLIASNCA